MTSINVQFSDSTEEVITSYFGSPQNSQSLANLGSVTTSDARWATFYALFQSSAQAVLPTPTTGP